MPLWFRSNGAAVLGLVGIVVAISASHFAISPRLVLVHEILKRLYYVPIVVAALHYGARGGAATALLATALYLPHTLATWSGWAVFAVESYGELVLFNVVGLVTGVLADRLHDQRNRFRDSNTALSVAYQRLEASTAQRIVAERLATVGRVAANVAHEVRTPLSAIQGCFEILVSDYPAGHPRREFLEILRTEIRRAESVVRTLLEVAEPASAQILDVDLNDVVRAAVRRCESAGHRLPHQAAVQLQVVPASIPVRIDPEQTERAIAELLAVARSVVVGETVTVSTARVRDAGELRISTTHAFPVSPACDRVDFLDRRERATLMLPLIRRIVEMQGGTLDADRPSGGLELVIRLPLCTPRHGVFAPSSSRPAATCATAARDHEGGV